MYEIPRCLIFVLTRPSVRYLHLGFRAPSGLMRRRRVCFVWAFLRLKHPLLSSKVEMQDYDDIRFVLVSCGIPLGRYSRRSTQVSGARLSNGRL
jgi:hypothetical protein